ncbi:hypothetical protein T492DRAFT_1072325 [Pavlovales sp. CCMP2436]|nr:hypothetical protein T492DRAFT_1072325 [Pavlovales sp. CCMP2436]|mmetsp:Transcript_34183/g.80580  ORF Transcript_34183/g.80580 Transcript_34183/m.80580 type:complete len:292 (-) Transcript_34183:169-1044(-)
MASFVITRPLLLAALLVASADALVAPAVRVTAVHLAAPRASVVASAEPTRRSAMATLLSAPAALALATFAPSAALAGESKANARLASLGLPPLANVNGYIQLAEFIGKSGPANIDGEKTRGFVLPSPLIVAFSYPQTWVTALPTTSSNGESGTVSAGNYIKGDSAAFVAAPANGAKSGSGLSKASLAYSVTCSATADVYQDVKVGKIVKREGAGDYVTFEYSYTLLTRAGFEVDRRGVGAATVVNDQLTGLITATTALRWKTESEKLMNLANSFAVYPVKKSAVSSESRAE